MAILRDPDSVESKMISEWEAQMSAHGPGRRPYQFQPYPMMLHLAGRPKSGLGAATIVETQEAGSENEANFYRGRGFRNTPLEAIEAWDATQFEAAELAANRNWQVAKGRIGEKAQAEVQRAEAAHADHMPDMPVTPIKKRVYKPRKPKVAELAAPVAAQE